MAITFRAAGTLAENATAAATLNVPYPAGMSAGDLMVLAFSVNTATVQSITGLTGAGWTSVFNSSTSGGTLLPSLSVLIKAATGSESGNLAVATTNHTSIGQIIAFAGVDNVTPQDVAASTVDLGTGTNNTPIPSLTTVSTGRALVYAAAQNSTGNTATAPTAPATFTETMDRSASNRAATMGYLIWAGSGATGTVTVNWSGSARNFGVLLALRPAGATSLYGRVHYASTTAPSAPTVPAFVPDLLRALDGTWQPCTESSAREGEWV